MLKKNILPTLFQQKKMGANSFFGYEQMAVYSVINNMLTN